MEHRLVIIEDKQTRLENKAETFDTTLDSIAKSMASLSVTMRSMENFQMETEIHRQIDVEERKESKRHWDDIHVLLKGSQEKDRSEKDMMWKTIRDAIADRKEEYARQQLINQSNGQWIDNEAKANLRSITWWRTVSGSLVVMLVGGAILSYFK